MAYEVTPKILDLRDHVVSVTTRMVYADKVLHSTCSGFISDKVNRIVGLALHCIPRPEEVHTV